MKINKQGKNTEEKNGVALCGLFKQDYVTVDCIKLFPAIKLPYNVIEPKNISDRCARPVRIRNINIAQQRSTMQAIELEAKITDTHEIHLKLPDDITASSAKIIIMYENEVPPIPVKKRVFGQYRGKLEISESFDDELPVDFWLGNPT